MMMNFYVRKSDFYHSCVAYKNKNKNKNLEYYTIRVINGIDGNIHKY